jgi:glycosyltransferase involved in cell wall biosynthesis
MRREEMLVTVVIPLFNKGKYVHRAICSVLAQSFRDFELIIINDGSTDNGPAIVDEFSDRRVCLIHQTNHGVSAARNRGIAKARGGLLAFLDADDEWKSCFLETVLNLRDKHPQCGAYATAYEIIEPNNRRWTPRYAGIPAPPWDGVIPSYFKAILSAPPLSSSSTVVPREVFTEVGGFPEDVRYGEDADTWCRIAVKYPIAFDSRVCATYHRDANGRKCESTAEYQTSAALKTLGVAIESGQLPRGVSRQDLSEYRNKLLIGQALACVVMNNKAVARSYLRAAMSTRVFRWRLAFWYVLSLLPYTWLTHARKLKALLRDLVERDVQRNLNSTVSAIDVSPSGNHETIVS